MRKKKINNIILIGVRFNPTAIFNLIEFESISKSDIQVSYFDLTPWFQPVKKEFYVKKIKADKITYYEINDQAEFIEQISRYSSNNSLIIYGGWWYVYIDQMNKLISGLNFTTILFNLNPITEFRSIASLLLKVKRIISGNRKGLPDICICEGSYKASLFKAMGYEDIWSFHSRDYEQYIELKNQNIGKQIEEDEGFILYIDQDLLDHRDFKMFNIEVIGIEEYLETLKNQLSLLSKELNKKVIFALHPSTNKDDYQKLFPEFEMYSGRTFELVKDASLVIGHFSNALDMAVLFNKRIILIDIPKKFSQHLYRSCKVFSKRMMGARYIRLQDLNRKVISGFSSVNKGNYNQYIRKIINANHPSDKTFSTLFFEYIEQRTKFSIKNTDI